jgi:hypothetical protein
MVCAPTTRSPDHALTFTQNMLARVHSTTGSVSQFLIIVIVVLIPALLAMLAQKRGRWQQRPRELRALAAQLGFDSFDQDSNAIFAMEWGFLSRLNNGSEQYAFNILRGKYHEYQLLVFDYHYQTGGNKQSNDHYFTMFMLVCKEAFPQLTIRPEHFYDKIAGAIGLENDIHFESAEFSRTFNVRSSDKKFAYDVCNAQMIEFLLANRDLQIEINGPVILLAFEPQLPVAKIEFNLQRLAQIHSLFPEYLFTTA